MTSTSAGSEGSGEGSLRPNRWRGLDEIPLPGPAAREPGLDRGASPGLGAVPLHLRRGRGSAGTKDKGSDMGSRGGGSRGGVGGGGGSAGSYRSASPLPPLGYDPETSQQVLTHQHTGSTHMIKSHPPM